MDDSRTHDHICIVVQQFKRDLVLMFLLFIVFY